MRLRRVVGTGTAGLLISLGLAVGVGGSANAANECRAVASPNWNYDHASTYQPAGTCKYHKIQGKWFVVGTGAYYYEWDDRRDLNPGNTVYVGYSLPSQYQLVQYRFCSDTGSYSCSYSSWLP